MTVNLARDGHVSVHVPTDTAGTGAHQHHRARLEHDGTSVGYWRCKMGTGDTRACPDEPDPWVRLGEKAAAARRRPPEAPRRPMRPVCKLHPVTRQRTYGKDDRRVCLDCHAQREHASRVAKRIQRDAVKAA